MFHTHFDDNDQQADVDLMNERGAKDLRAQKGMGPEISELLMDCIREAK